MSCLINVEFLLGLRTMKGMEINGVQEKGKNIAAKNAPKWTVYRSVILRHALPNLKQQHLANCCKLGRGSSGSAEPSFSGLFSSPLSLEIVRDSNVYFELSVFIIAITQFKLP